MHMAVYNPLAKIFNHDYCSTRRRKKENNKTKRQFVDTSLGIERSVCVGSVFF